MTVTEPEPRIRAAQDLLRGGQPQQAAVLLSELLAEQPENLEARYALAVAERHLHRWPDALATLSSILEQRPGFGRAHQEAGYNHIAERRFAAAGAAFERAVNADPSLINSWKCLAKLYADSGRSDKRRAAEQQIAFLAELPTELLAVIGYLSEDRLDDAQRLCKAFLREHKTHIEGMRLLAEIATRNKVLDEAEFLLDSCVAFAPSHRQARIQYASALLRTQKFALAYEQTRELLGRGAAPQRQPDYGIGDAPAIETLHAAACAGLGRSDEAIAIYDRLMRDHPDNVFFPVSAAHVHKAAGRADQAVALYRHAYRIKPDHGDAYWSLANTKSYAFADAEVARMEQALNAAGTAEADRIQLAFALGSASERRRDFRRAFDYYARGNAMQRSGAHHSAEHLQVRIDSQIETCTPELFAAAARQGAGSPAADPIFIVGLPRAGSTLLEQILASHSQVDGTMELHNILNLAKRLRGRDAPGEPPRYPRILECLDADTLRRFGEQFLDQTRAYRGDAPRFIDKMPNNFFHIGLIRLILPNAKVIDARRHAMACCFSAYKQLFGEGQEFSYALADVGNYYRQYARLMEHWDAVLPGFVLRVRHEDVVDDLEGQTRRLLDFCGLPFEDACLDYHRTERSIRTPSAQQVRQPIYRDGLDQWRNFEPWLAPLKAALGEALPEDSR